MKLSGVLLVLLTFLPLVRASENFIGSFAEPVDGGNLDVVRSTFDGTVAVLSPRWHESEALGTGSGAMRWRNMLFAIQGVKGRIVTFRLPMTLPGSNVMIHNMDTVTLRHLHPVWSRDGATRQWRPFSSVTRYGPAGPGSALVRFPWDSAPAGESATVSTGAGRKEDYGWEFTNPEPFEDDIIYVSINDHAPVQEFYDWLQADVFTNAWVRPTASEALPGSFMIGYQSGALPPAGTAPAFSRPIPDLPLYAFRIQEPGTTPSKLLMLVSGQHPYEGQTKSALRGAVEWMLDPADPAAAAFRREYAVLVYPLVNPSGEYAGLWRGTAFNPKKDPNRNWNTTLTDPAANRGIDTVIVHKNAMLADVAALGLGQPFAVFDFHQNYGDRTPSLDYAAHVENPAANAYIARLNGFDTMADIVASADTSTLRGWWTARGAAMAIVFERSTYHTLASERAFGRAAMQALAPDIPPAIEPAPEPQPEPELPPAPVATTLINDSFSGDGVLTARTPDLASSGDSSWQIGRGGMSVIDGVGVSTADYLRALVDAGTADGAVSAKITLLGANGYAGLVLRARDADSFLMFRIKPDGWIFARVSGSTATTLASGPLSCGVGTSHQLRAECDGERIALSVDGVAVYSGWQTFNLTSTRVGLSSGTMVKFSVDDFVVETLPADPAPDPDGKNPPEVLVDDAFEGVGLLDGRLPDAVSMGNNRWLVARGTAVVQQGVVLTGSDYVRAQIETGHADGAVQGTFRLLGPNAYAGLAMRIVDQTSFLFFRLKPTGWVFASVRGGTAKTIASGPGVFAAGTPYTLRAEQAGTEFQLFIEGERVFAGTESYNLSATGAGFSSGALVPFSVDDFIVER